MTQLSDPKDIARNAKTILQFLSLLFDDDILKNLVQFTIIYIDSIKQRHQRKRDAATTDLVEMKAFIGLMLVIGLQYDVLLRFVHFDDIRDRAARQQIDRFAAIHQIIEIMLRNCKNYNTPSKYVTLDEELVTFNGRCGL